MATVNKRYKYIGIDLSTLRNETDPAATAQFVVDPDIKIDVQYDDEVAGEEAIDDVMSRYMFLPDSV